MKKFFATICAAAFLISGCGGEKISVKTTTNIEIPKIEISTNETPQPETPPPEVHQSESLRSETPPPETFKASSQSEPQKNFYSNGQFKVGADIAAGEYIAIGTGYVEVAKSSTSDAGNILINDNIENAQRYVDAHDGEYIKVIGNIKLYPSADAPKIDTSGKFPAGQYKVGTDIKAGEYKITLDAKGYFAVTKDTRRDYVKNQFTNEGGSFYVTVDDGQYLQIKKGEGIFVE